MDVTLENGPFETTRGTHMVSKEEGLRRLESGEIKLEPLTMREQITVFVGTKPSCHKIGVKRESLIQEGFAQSLASK